MTATLGVAPEALSHPRIAAGVLLAGQDPAELVRRFGSPLYVYDLDVLTARVERLRPALPRIADLAFAVKANPLGAVLRHLAGLGLGADVASGGELEGVVRAGFDPRGVVFTGPGKTDAEIAHALRTGIRALTVESLDELDVVLDMAALARPTQGILLRLAIEGSSESMPIIGGPGAAKFGLLPDEVDLAIERLRRAGAVVETSGSDLTGPFRLLGLHAFGASNVLDAELIVDGVTRLAERAEQASLRHGVTLTLLDAGGGLGIPYANDVAPLDLEMLRRGLAREVESWPRRPALRGTRLLFEPGRFLVGPAGAYLVTVVRTKPRGDRVIAVVDGGIHQLLRPALLRQSPRVVPVGEAAARSALSTVDVVGPLCTGLDVLATGVTAPTPRAGDLLAVLDTGAYGFTESMPLFLSHPVPAEVTISGGRATLARPRREPGEG